MTKNPLYGYHLKMAPDDTKKQTLWVKAHGGDWAETVGALFQAAAPEFRKLYNGRPVLIKPNLVEALEPPITTPVGLVGAIIDCVRSISPGAELIIGEGTGASDYETPFAFDELGYTELARVKDVRLVDLNHEPTVELSNPELLRWPVMHLPKIVMESFIISVPVLKAHTLAGVTLTMKNMMGAPPPLHYQAGGHWKKSAFHTMMQESVLDLNRYRTPDMTILDATVGMSEGHLGGPTCKPPPGVVVLGFDPVATDAYGCKLLKRDWRDIRHISKADKVLGRAGAAEVVEL